MNRSRRHWTPAEDETLADAWTRGAPVEVIARALGRMEDAARWRARWLRLPPRGRLNWAPADALRPLVSAIQHEELARRLHARWPGVGVASYTRKLQRIAAGEAASLDFADKLAIVSGRHISEIWP